MEPYVFISYGSANKRNARKVREHLEQAGIPCWMAPESIEGGKSYASQIPQAINNCSAFVLILDAGAMQSQWVSREVDRAIGQKKRIFPFMTEPVALTEEFEFYLNNAQYYTAYQNYPAFTEQLTREITAHLRSLGYNVPVLPTPPGPIPSKDDKRKKRFLLGSAAAAVVLAALLLLVVLKLFGGSPTAEGPGSAPSWEQNLLRSDSQEYSHASVEKDEAEAGHLKVFGSEYERCQIKQVFFLDTLADQPAEAAVLFRDQSVTAWLVPNGALYDLYLAAEGGICAPKDCSYLFAGYTQATAFFFNGNFHTDNVLSMHDMFGHCTSLETLDLSELNTALVQDMGGMFINDKRLEKLTLEGVNTESVTTMRAMFLGCRKLTELNLSSFSTSKVRDFGMMFYNCTALRTLAFGDRFVIPEAANAAQMYENCSSLPEEQKRFR